ncbi:hypothetical protein GGR58DRAFT_494306 [Xylaria digitata]|nr:hypothetical protein GGR58DRAFT_494306 [Xylaria digitata]
MITPMHAGIRGLIGGSVGVWQRNIMESNDPRISDISETISSLSSERLKFSEGSGAKDTKAPDWEIRHMCKRSDDSECQYPNLVFEVGWTQTKEELKEKAEFYINRSNGEIRTIVAVHMHEMFLAERKNEIKLKRMYRKGEVDGSYCYWEDENNQTGSASILVWRARKKRDGTVHTGNTEEKIFRDLQGNAIQSGSLDIPFHDFICTGMMNVQGGKLKAPLLEISSNALCKPIQHTLRAYRKQRALEIREEVEQEEQAKKEKKKKDEERL